VPQVFSLGESGQLQRNLPQGGAATVAIISTFRREVLTVNHIAMFSDGQAARVRSLVDDGGAAPMRMLAPPRTPIIRVPTR
jgi:hypothetical protein